MQSWIHVLEWRATVRPGVTALVDDRGAEYSYAALRAELERRAGGWAGLGVGPGDIVAIVAKNSADFLVHAFALMRAGATPAFVNWRLSGRELAEVLALVEPRGRGRRRRVRRPGRHRGARARAAGGDRRRAGAARLDRRRGAGPAGPAAARTVRRHGPGARAHQRHHREGQGDPAAARRADDERRGLRHRDRRPGRRVAPPADPAPVPPGRLRPVPAGAADRGDGLHPYRLQPGRGHRRHRAGPDRVLHRRALAHRHAGGRDPPPRGCRPRRRPQQPARDRLRHRADHPVLARRRAGGVRLPVPADLRQHREPEHDQPARAGRPPARPPAAGQRRADLVRLGSADHRPRRPGCARGHPGRAPDPRRVPVLRVLARPGRHRGRVRRGRLVPDGGHRPADPGRLPLHPGPGQGHDHQRRREHLPGRGRGGARPAPGRGRGRGGGRARPHLGRGRARRDHPRGRAHPPRPRRSSPGAGTSWPTSSAPRPWSSPIRCRARPPARCSSGSCGPSSPFARRSPRRRRARQSACTERQARGGPEVRS